MTKLEIVNALAVQEKVIPSEISRLQPLSIDILKNKLKSTEHAFQVSNITLDQGAKLLLEGNTNQALQALLNGNQKDFDSFRPHGDWQGVMAEHPENTEKAISYERARAKNHLLGRYVETGDRSYLQSLEHDTNFNAAREKLAKLSKTPRWQKRLNELTELGMNPNSIEVSTPQSNWYSKHQQLINTTVNEIAKQKKEFLPDVEPKTTNPSNDSYQEGISRVMKEVWLKNSLITRDRHSAKQADIRYKTKEGEISKDILNNIKTMGANSNGLIEELGRAKDRAFFGVPKVMISYKNNNPDAPTLMYEAPHVIQDLHVPLTREKRASHFTGYVALLYCENEQGQTLVQISPLKQVGTQMIEGSPMVGASAQKSIANWKREGKITTGEHNTNPSPTLDILVNTALAENAEHALPGIRVVGGVGVMVDPGRIIDNTAIILTDLNQVFTINELEAQKKNELLAGDWYNLTDVRSWLETRTPGIDLPISNAFLQVTLAEVAAEKAGQKMLEAEMQTNTLIDAVLELNEEFPGIDQVLLNLLQKKTQS